MALSFARVSEVLFRGDAGAERNSLSLNERGRETLYYSASSSSGDTLAGLGSLLQSNMALEILETETERSMNKSIITGGLDKEREEVQEQEEEQEEDDYDDEYDAEYYDEEDPGEEEDTDEDEDSDEDEEDDMMEQYQGVAARSNIPLLPISQQLMDDMAMLSNFECWIGHTDFNITKQIICQRVLAKFIEIFLLNVNLVEIINSNL